MSAKQKWITGYKSQPVLRSKKGFDVVRFVDLTIFTTTLALYVLGLIGIANIR